MYPALAIKMYLLFGGPVYYHKVSHHKKRFFESWSPWKTPVLYETSIKSFLSVKHLCIQFQTLWWHILVLYFKDVITFHILLLGSLFKGWGEKARIVCNISNDIKLKTHHFFTKNTFFHMLATSSLSVRAEACGQFGTPSLNSLVKNHSLW